MITGTFSFNYSLKCIPNASKLQLQKILVSSIESLLNRMRWKLFWAKSPPLERRNKKTFGFKSCNKAHFDPDLMRFEKDLIKIVPELEMKKANNNLQEQMKMDKMRIKRSKEMIVSADKTDNHYLIPVNDYKKMLLDNISKDYRKTTMNTVNQINREAANIAKELELEDRIEALSTKPAFLTVKDHKEDWPTKISCRLINPTKSNIGIIPKKILDRINQD